MLLFLVKISKYYTLDFLTHPSSSSPSSSSLTDMMSCSRNSGCYWVGLFPWDWCMPSCPLLKWYTFDGHFNVTMTLLCVFVRTQPLQVASVKAVSHGGIFFIVDSSESNFPIRLLELLKRANYLLLQLWLQRVSLRHVYHRALWWNLSHRENKLMQRAAALVNGRWATAGNKWNWEAEVLINAKRQTFANGWPTFEKSAKMGSRFTADRSAPGGETRLKPDWVGWDVLHRNQIQHPLYFQQ